MFCTKCGFEIKDGYKFCPKCGTPAYIEQEKSKDEMKKEEIEEVIREAKVIPIEDTALTKEERERDSLTGFPAGESQF